MKTIDALEGAVSMLNEISRGKEYEWGAGTTATARLRAYEAAAARQRLEERQLAETQAEFRALAEQRRQAEREARHHDPEPL